MALSVNHVESGLAPQARSICSPGGAAVFGGLGVHLAESGVLVEDVSVVALLACEFVLVGVAALNVAGLHADAERVGDGTLFAGECKGS